MSGFKEIVGQEHIVTHIKNAVKLNKISHAYMICGEKGMGKKLVADRFSMLLQCEGDNEKPCMQCRACKQAMGKNNPDIKWVYHEKPNTISVEEAREQLINDIAIKPYSSKYKIYIIDEAEKMSVAAQNAILKTIEEPPEYGIIMILTQSKEMMLETIQSRCVLLEMRPVQKNDFKTYFQSKMKVPDYEIDSLLEFSAGNIGKARDMVESDQYSAMRDHVVEILKNIKKMDAATFSSKMKEAANYKNDMNGYMDLITMWFRDILMYKATKSDKKLIFKEQANIIKNHSEGYDYNGLNEILEEIKKVQVRLNSNVNFELTLEVMYLKIRDLLTEV